jgi:hypothetical protein
VRTTRLSADHPQQLGYPCISFREMPLELGFTNALLQVFQEGDEALREGLGHFVFCSKRTTYFSTNAIQLAGAWPGVHGASSNLCSDNALPPTSVPPAAGAKVTHGVLFVVLCFVTNDAELDLV